MDSQDKNELQQTDEARQQLLHSAVACFQEHGFTATQMSQIADRAGVSEQITLQYFPDKEAIVSALYADIEHQTAQQILTSPTKTMALNFETALNLKLEQLTPYRSMFSESFHIAFKPNPDAQWVATRSTMMNAFQHIVSSASDAPKGDHARQFGAILYSIHLLMLLFWFYDSTENQKATHDMIKFSRDGLQWLRPMLILPPVSASIARLSKILEQVFA